MASTVATVGSSVAPMRQRQQMEFPYKHSTGETVGRFLAGLKEQKKIWGQRVSGQGVVVPPLGYSEIDGSEAGEWVEVKDTGVITAAARVDKPIERLHPSTSPFAFVLVKLDGADTGLAHVVKTDLDRVAVGARVQAVWAADDARVGSIRDIDSFQVIADAPAPTVKPAAKVQMSKPAKPVKPAKPAPSPRKAVVVKSTKPKPAGKKAAPAKGAKPKKVVAKPAKPAAKKPPAKKTTAKKTAAKKPTVKKATAKKATKPARAKASKAKSAKSSMKKKVVAKKSAKPTRGKVKQRKR